MPLPAPLETLTVRGTWLSPVSGGPLIGWAKLTAVNSVLSPSGDVLLTRAPNKKTLNASGAAEWTGVLASDSTGLSGTVTYRLQVSGEDYYESRLIQLSKAQTVAGVIQLADVADAEPAPAVVTYVLAASVGTVGGPAGPLDATGKVPAAQIPAQGGTPDATTTSKGVVQLAGDLAGTAAAPTVPALAGKADDADITALDGRLDILEARYGSPYPISAYGFHSASCDLDACRISSALDDWRVRVHVLAGKAITAVGLLVAAAGTAALGGLNGFAVYSDDGTTLLGQTATDDTLWSATGWRVRTLTAPIAAQATDRFVQVGISLSGYSPGPTVLFTQIGPGSGIAFNGGYNVPTHRRTALLAGLSDSAWPATLPNGNDVEYLPFVALA